MESPSVSGVGGGGAPPPPPAVGGFGDNLPRAPRDAEVGGNYTGVSRRKQDQRQREEEEKLKAKNKYDELVDRAMPIDGILEIEEEGKEDLSAVVGGQSHARNSIYTGSCS